MSINPIRGKIILRPSASGYKGRIAVPDNYKDAFATCLVMGRSKELHHELKVGAVVFVEVGFGERYAPINDKGDIVCKESNILGILKNKKFYPLGDSILFKRDRGNKQSNGVITALTRTEYQSLFGWVVRIGLPKNKKQLHACDGINVNSYCRLTGYCETMKDLYLEGEAHLLVKPKHLLYEVCQTE